MFYFNKTHISGPTLRNGVRKHLRNHHGEILHWSRTRKSAVQSKLTLLSPDFKKFLCDNYDKMIEYTWSATGATKLHLPRKAKSKLVGTHGPVLLYFYLELNQSDFKSEGFPNLVRSGLLLCSLICRHLPATVARAHECLKNTNKRTGPHEASCSQNNHHSSKQFSNYTTKGRKGSTSTRVITIPKASLLRTDFFFQIYKTH